jgi:hypothetical protein
MKQAILAICALAALSSCASMPVPEPEGEGDSLVIGYFALDFPDGYFNYPPRKIVDRIQLIFLNETRKTRFSLTTSAGYYCFLANGTDDYSLESYGYEDVGAQARLGPAKVDWKFGITPGKVVYLGHLTISYKSEKMKVEASSERRSSSFDVDSSYRWEEEATLQYIETLNPESRWLDCELVEFTKRE